MCGVGRRKAEVTAHDDVVRRRDVMMDFMVGWMIDIDAVCCVKPTLVPSKVERQKNKSSSCLKGIKFIACLWEKDPSYQPLSQNVFMEFNHEGFSL